MRVELRSKSATRGANASSHCGQRALASEWRDTRATMLTPGELAFLKSQNLTADDVYDGRYQSAARWKAGVRVAGLALVLGAACSRGGHRLRTRSGHCAQCDTRNIAYQDRHHSPGYVYIAGSLSAKLLKIGIAVDVEQRKRNLRHQAYGGIHDWEMLFYAKVENRGKVEREALRLLQRFQHHPSV